MTPQIRKTRSNIARILLYFNINLLLQLPYSVLRPASKIKRNICKGEHLDTTLYVQGIKQRASFVVEMFYVIS